MTGRSTGAHHWGVRGDISTGGFSIHHFKADRLLAVDSVNSAKDHLLARKLLDSGLLPTPQRPATTASICAFCSRFHRHILRTDFTRRFHAAVGACVPNELRIVRSLQRQLARSSSHANGEGIALPQKLTASSHNRTGCGEEHVTVHSIKPMRSVLTFEQLAIRLAGGLNPSNTRQGNTFEGLPRQSTTLAWGGKSSLLHLTSPLMFAPSVRARRRHSEDKYSS
jgi:hypothetical protein